MKFVKKLAVSTVVAGLAVAGATGAHATPVSMVSQHVKNVSGDDNDFIKTIDAANVLSTKDNGAYSGITSDYYYLDTPTINVRGFKQDTATISPDVEIYTLTLPGVVIDNESEEIIKGSDWSSPADPNPYFKVTHSTTHEHHIDAWADHSVGVQCLRNGSGDSIRSVNSVGMRDNFSATNVTCSGPSADFNSINFKGSYNIHQGQVVSGKFSTNAPSSSKVSYSVTGLPAGVSVDANGNLTGTTTAAAGDYPVVINAYDPTYDMKLPAVFHVLNGDHAITGINVPDGAKTFNFNTDVDQQISAVNPNPDTTYTITGLPHDEGDTLAMDSHGHLTGMTQDSGDFSVTVSTHDGSGTSFSTSFTMHITDYTKTKKLTL